MKLRELIQLIRKSITEDVDRNLICSLIDRDDLFICKVIDLIEGDPEISNEKIIESLSQGRNA